MGVLFLVVLGIVVGWLGAAIAEVDEGVFARMGVGIVGAFLGGLLMFVLTGKDPIFATSWLELLFGIIGAAVMLNIVGHLATADYEPHDSSVT
ncbi:MAG: GlsB/YeaQ/YmgE family stress response membrane protein [Candidatus Saccharimonadales bacterium]